MNEKFEVAVSIGDAPKALVALRTYGLTETEATEVINEESTIAIYEHGIVPKNSLSPEMIEIFGHQHVKDALSYAYLYMDDYGLEWITFKNILYKLLNVYRAEDLICNPETIRYFIDSIFEKISINQDYYTDGQYADGTTLIADVLFNLGYEDIVEMSENPFDKEIEEFERADEGDEN